MAFTFLCDRLTDDAIADLAPDFESLAPSEYADGAYRYRRYSIFSFDRAAGALELLANDEFVQSDELNRHQGNVARRYDDLLPSTWQSQGFAGFMKTFADAAELPARATVEVHQMRIIAATKDAPAEATPEGVHQDGYDRIAVLSLGRRNALGGEMHVHRGRFEAPFMTLGLAEGQYVIEDDSTFWHSAAPVSAIDEAEPGTFDIFVFTANR